MMRAICSQPNTEGCIKVNGPLFVRAFLPLNRVMSSRWRISVMVRNKMLRAWVSQHDRDRANRDIFSLQKVDAPGRRLLRGRSIRLGARSYYLLFLRVCRPDSAESGGRRSRTEGSPHDG